MSEVVVSDPCRDQQVIVDVGMTVDDDAPCIRVHRTNLTQKHGDVALATQDMAQRRRNRRRGEPRRCHLIQQRLERVMVASVYQQNIRGRMTQPFNCVQASESTADNDDPGFCYRWHLGSEFTISSLTGTCRG